MNCNSKSARVVSYEIAGRNSRLATLDAAVLHLKLGSLDRLNRARTALVERYRHRLPSWCVPQAVDPAAEPVHHLAVVQLPNRAASTRELDTAEIGWGVHYPVPCHRQAAFAGYATESLPVAEAAADRVLSLPLSPTMEFDQVDRVCAVLRVVGPDARQGVRP